MKSPLFLAAAVLVAGCGSDDDGDREPRARTDAAPAPAVETAVFRSRAIGFTFRYPKEFAAQRKPRRGVLGQVSLEPGASLNAIQVRRSAARQLRPKRYLDEFQRDVSKAVGEAVEQREERIGELETGVLEFADTVERAGETVEFTASSYFFAGAGRTWQVECIADSEHREQIEEACRAALESVRFRARRAG